MYTCVARARHLEIGQSVSLFPNIVFTKCDADGETAQKYRIIQALTGGLSDKMLLWCIG